MKIKSWSNYFKPTKQVFLHTLHKLSGNDKNKSRGSMLFVGGLVMLLFLDNDAALDHHVESGDESYVVHALYAMFDQLG